MSYKRSDYGKNVLAGKDRNNAASRGWGSGWPNCQFSKFVIIEGGGVRLSMRREVAELALQLILNAEAMGYDIKAGQTWGVACRAIRNTNYPSNHSWGLAMDWNSLANPMAAFRTDIPPKIVHMMEDCNWFWGGRYVYNDGGADTMHFEYIGRPSDVAADLRKAKAYAGEVDDMAEYGKDILGFLKKEFKGFETKINGKTAKRTHRQAVAAGIHADVKADKIIAALSAVSKVQGEHTKLIKAIATGQKTEATMLRALDTDVDNLQKAVDELDSLTITVDDAKE